MFLTLIGYRGSGKTSVAEALAQKLGLTAVDSDQIIQQRAACTIKQIFERQGETAFRNLEAEVIADILSGPGTILSAGGGAILRENTRERMRSVGPVVWLTATPEELGRRIAADQVSSAQRPSLTDAGLLQEIESVLQQRTPIYEAASTLQIETEGKSPEEIAEEIIAALHLKPSMQTKKGN